MKGAPRDSGLGSEDLSGGGKQQGPLYSTRTSQHWLGNAAAFAFSFTGNLEETWSNYQHKDSGSTFRMC